MIYLLADTVTGVWEVDTLDGEDCVILTQSDFYNALRTLQAGQLIGTQVYSEWYSRIDADYGVQFKQ